MQKTQGNAENTRKCTNACFDFPLLSHEARSCPAGGDAGVTQPHHSTSLALICAVTLSGGEQGAGTGARSVAGLPPGTLTRPCPLPVTQWSEKHNRDAVGSQTRFSRQLKVVSSCAQERGQTQPRAGRAGGGCVERSRIKHSKHCGMVPNAPGADAACCSCPLTRAQTKLVSSRIGKAENTLPLKYRQCLESTGESKGGVAQRWHCHFARCGSGGAACWCDVAVRSPPASAAPSPSEGLRICSFASSPFPPTASQHGSKSCWGLSWGHQCRRLVMPHSTVHLYWSCLLARVAKILHKGREIHPATHTRVLHLISSPNPQRSEEDLICWARRSAHPAACWLHTNDQGLSPAAGIILRQLLGTPRGKPKPEGLQKGSTQEALHQCA